VALVRDVHHRAHLIAHIVELLSARWREFASNLFGLNSSFAINFHGTTDPARLFWSSDPQSSESSVTPPFEGARARKWPLRRCVQMLTSGLTLVALMLATPMQSAYGADTLTVFIDQAKIVRLPTGVATVVIGNPLIADVTLQEGGVLIVTGKGYGVTNIIALDKTGTLLGEQSIEVRGPRGDIVVVYRGLNRESYSCTPKCERRITLGDTPDFFAATIGESTDLSSRAQGAASPQQPH
jgi:hypothetical protein